MIINNSLMYTFKIMLKKGGAKGYCNYYYVTFIVRARF